MTRTRTAGLTSGLITLAFVAAACGGDDDSAAGGGDGVLSDVCPATVVVQTDWFPEAEHGALYNLIGEGYTVNTDTKVVNGPMVIDGQNLGVNFEVRTGGPAIGFAPVSSYVYTDDSITFGYANTEAQVLSYEDAPLLSVVAPLEINPQKIGRAHV